MNGYGVAFTRVYVLRAEAQDLLRYLDPVLQAANGGGDVFDHLEELGPCLQEKRAVLDDFAPAMAGLLAEDPTVGAGSGDLLTQITNALRAALRALDRLTSLGSPPDPQSVQKWAEKASVALNELVRHAGFLTIPNRVNEHLDDISVGDRIDFATEFSDELPSTADQAAVLAFLAGHSGPIHGWVDTEKGLIYRTSQSKWFRLFTYAAPFLTTLAVLGAVYLADVLRDGHDWWHAAHHRNAWLPTLAVVLGGAVLHLSIARLKRIHFGTDLEIVALSKRLTWLHLRWVSVCGSIIPVFIVWAGLRWYGNHSLLAYFFAGYSVDSLAEILLGRLELAGGAGARQLLEGLKTRTGQSNAQSPRATTPTTSTS